DHGAPDGRARVGSGWLLALPVADLDLLEPIPVQVLAQLYEHLVRVLVGDEPEVELGRRLRREHGLRARPLVSRRDAGEVARGQEEHLLNDLFGLRFANELLEADEAA